jgi:hypothetical protein
LLLVVALVAAAAAQAEIVVSRDNSGRSITFDVRSAAADVEWYAGLLRSAAHGDEISAVTIRIVPPADVPEYCGSGASACYGNRRRPVIVVPAGRDTRTAQIMLHEYGHHLDFAWPVPGLPEPNGTPFWWGAKGMAQLLRDGLVAFDRVGQRARIEIVCNGARVGRRALTRGRRSATLDLRRLGPARCDARLVSTTGARLEYTLRLRLAIEA